jgi:hypothetical protein
MKNKNKQLYFIVGGLFLALVLFFAFFYKPEKTINWSENYREGNKDPYGLHIARQLVAKYQPAKKLIAINGTLTEGLPATTKTPANYVFMGASPYFDSTDITRLLAFVHNGNTAFLATKNLPKSLRDSLVKRYADPIVAENYVAEADEETATDAETQAIFDSLAMIEAQKAENDEPTIFDTNDDKPETDLPKDVVTPTIHYYSEFFQEESQDSAANFNFKHTRLAQKQPFRYIFKDNSPGSHYAWYGIDVSLFSNAFNKGDIAVLGTMNDSSACFIKVRYGKGFFLLHASPILFTNYFLLNRDAVDYLQSTLSYLPEGDTYWDEPSKIFRDLNGEDKDWHPEVGMGYKGPFDYLLSQPALRWAFYLLWAIAIIYLIFRSKRTQRAIPILEEYSNTSIEFADNMGRLYYLQNDHKKLAEQKMKLFLHTLRDKYKLPTHLESGQLIPRIVEKTGVSETIVRPIFTQNEFINYSGEISQTDLIEFHNYLTAFYQSTKN